VSELQCAARGPLHPLPGVRRGAARTGGAWTAGAGAEPRAGSITDALMQVRSTDIEPYIGLRYLSKLFKFMALLLLVAMMAEIALGFREQGTEAIPRLLGVATRLLGIAGLLWGAGDLAILMIDIGHDVRAARILIGRQAAHHLSEHHDEPHQRAGERAPRP
jgi:hypothetical protein